MRAVHVACGRLRCSFLLFAVLSELTYVCMLSFVFPLQLIHGNYNAHGGAGGEGVGGTSSGQSSRATPANVGAVSVSATAPATPSNGPPAITPPSSILILQELYLAFVTECGG